jgi:superfamily II DNA or RNA helicase
MMITGVFDGATCFFNGDISTNVLNELNRLLAISPEESTLASFSKIMVLRDGLTLLMNNENGYVVPTGLIKSIMSVVRAIEPETQMHFRNGSMGVKAIAQLSPILFEHQRNAVETAIDKIRGIIKAPTGAGKSYIIGNLAYNCTQVWLTTFRATVLITVPTRNLLYQMKKDIEEFYEKSGYDTPDIGLIGDGNYELSKSITIAIPDTLHSRRDDEKLQSFLGNIYCLIGDECHEYATPSYYAVSLLMKRRKYSIGLSATPWTNNGMNILLEGMFGPRIVDINEADMIDKGIIMKPQFKFYYAPGAYISPKLMSMGYSHWVYNQAYKALILNNKGRNELIVDLAIEEIKKNEGPIVILVNKVGTTVNKKTGKPSASHAQVLYDMLLARGIDLPIVHGGTPGPVQDLILRQLAGYEIGGVIAGPQVLSAGISIHSIVSVILAGAGRTDNTLIQRVGRALRLKEGKARPTIIDFIDPLYYFATQSSVRMDVVESVYPGCTEVITRNK